MTYAQGTTVPVDKTRMEIEKLLKKNGATGIASLWDDAAHSGRIICRLQERMLRFDIKLPSMESMRLTPKGQTRHDEKNLANVVAAEERRKWRALLLIIKAKLELISSGDSTIEKEFLADLLMPNGSTVYENTKEAIASAYLTGGMPTTLMLGSGS